MLLSKASRKTINEGRIIAAAVQLFSRGGYNGTSTRDIANLAEVNETTMFRYYSDKKAVFSAALRSQLEPLKLDRNLQARLAAEDDPQAVIPMISQFLIETLFERPELLRLLLFSALELPSDELYRKHFGGIFDAIELYLGKCASRGTIRSVDSHIATLGLAGAVLADVTLHQIFMNEKWSLSAAKGAAAIYSELWLLALCPKKNMPYSEIYKPA